MTNMISDDPVPPDFTVKLQELKRKVPNTQRSSRSPPNGLVNGNPIKSNTIQKICGCADRADILIVDDNIFNQVTIMAMINQITNLKVEKASNGLEALLKVKARIVEDQNKPCICNLQKRNYKLIFMDCNMPVMDGFQTTIEIKKCLAND